MLSWTGTGAEIIIQVGNSCIVWQGFCLQRILTHSWLLVAPCLQWGLDQQATATGHKTLPKQETRSSLVLKYSNTIGQRCGRIDKRKSMLWCTCRHQFTKAPRQKMGSSCHYAVVYLIQIQTQKRNKNNKHDFKNFKPGLQTALLSHMCLIQLQTNPLVMDIKLSHWLLEMELSKLYLECNSCMLGKYLCLAWSV